MCDVGAALAANCGDAQGLFAAEAAPTENITAVGRDKAVPFPFRQAQDERIYGAASNASLMLAYLLSITKESRITFHLIRATQK